MKIILLLSLPLLLMADFMEVDESKILDRHNTLRAQHFDAPLKYSTALEKSSKKWALHLAQKEGCRMVHSHGKLEGRGVYGENLFWASARVQKSKKSTDKEWTITRSSQDIDDAKPVQDWYDEIGFYNYDTGACKAGEMCGHYTQVVWENSEEVGCAAYQCDDKSQVWVCQYFPAGNYVGQKPFKK